MFNGFLEGQPHLLAEVYAHTLVLHNHADPPQAADELIQEAQTYLLEQLPWLRAVLVKARYARTAPERRGRITHGQTLDTRVVENGVRYALDLQLNQDTGFYLDTRHLRAWLKEHLHGKTVLNTFAYTGSLGVAALAGGASRVVHTDRNRTFLNVAKTSYTLNGFPIRAADFLAGDFFSAVSRLKRANEQFDCVIVDPPFFAETSRGRVDLVHEGQRLINKVRPLVRDGGWLVAINNALFVSGAAYSETLTRLCADGYLSLEAILPVPPDCAGYPSTVVRALPADPAPFNHSTKIAVLRVRRKS